MDPIKNIISQFSKMGVLIFVDNGQLKTRADKHVMTPELIAIIKENKQQLLDYFAKGFTFDAAADEERIPPRPQGELPLSFAQHRLWLMDQISGSGAHYNMPGVIKLSGKLDREAVRQALNSIVERHESLRTLFRVSEDGQPILEVQDVAYFQLNEVDLSSLPEQERQLKLSQMMAEEGRSAFDLSTDFMLRARLIQCAAEEHRLVVTLHHIASDGWSLGVLVNEFCALYRAYTEGKANPLPALPIQYADYAHWQRHWLQGEVLETQLGYWSNQLAGLPIVHNLPLDHARPALQSFSGDTYSSQLDVTISKALNTLCQSQGATLFMGLHAAFSVLLSRYSNETDIVVGSPIANREQADIAGLIGFFVNTLVLRSDLSGNPGFTSLLNQSKAMLLDAYAHQQVPFEQIVEQLQPERHLGYSPLFQVMLVLQNNAVGNLDIPGLTLSLAEQRIGVAKYDLTLFVSESASGLQLDWEYNTDVFESNTIARMANHFGLLLNALTSTPNESVFKADMLSAPERQQLLVDWNSTQLDYQQDKCVHELFEAQAETNPQATALIFENQHLSYQQLNERANQLAHYLITEKHVTPDSLVGICVERSVEMVVGILAILKAGGAYVPLDPEYPQARLQYMLDDAGLTAVLTQGHLRDATPVSDEQAIYLDSAEFQQQWQAYPTSKPNSRAQGLTPNHLAYVIYTSGSTGNPKGVMVAHGNVVNFLATMADKPGLAPDDCLLAVTSTSFDIHGLEVFLPLVMGAKLVVAPRSATSDPDALATLLVQHQVSIMQATPATWKMLLDANWQPQAPLKALCGGEALGLHLAQALLAHQGLTLWNMYGPTETTIWSTTQEILATDKHILMGQPIGNTEVYIAGDSLALAPVGVAGELLLGGAGVTRGYLNRSDLTNDKFIPNPFYTGNNSASSERLYKTGDLVRWLPSGKLEFLGRIDHQVKVHGFRIELGEIEHALISHAEVKDAVVVAKDTKTGDKRLVAYIVAEGLAEANEPAAGGDEANTLAHQTLISTLRQHLGQSLPEYMVPAVFMVLDQLPLTPNGKVDRKSLPEPDLSRQQNTYVAPRTETEQAICDLWQDVLSVERVGITDNFFQLGGHSLSATRLVARINQSFTVALPLKTLFTSPTVESLVVALSALESGPVMPALVKVSREQALQPSFAQQRLWLLDQIEGGSAHYNMPGGLTLSGPLDYEALNKAFSDIIERHESLRTCFTVGNDGQPVQVIQAATPFLIPLTDLSTLEEGARNLQQAAQVVAEAGHVFDLSAGLMLRAGLLKLAEDEHFLLVTMHHIASDGWSMSILLNEVCALYRAYTEGKANPLPALPIQYADYAHWQRHWLQVEVLETQLGYWSRQLAGLPIVHNLPLDHARPALQSFSGDTYSSQLDVTISKALNTLCQSQGATLFMGLHAAFSVLLSRYSNETDIVVGSPIANREQADIAGLIGFFVNTLVLRSDLSGNPGFTSLLNQSKAMLLDAYAHQQVPFEQIVEQLQPERHLGYSPLFQVMLVLQNNAVGNLDIPGLTLSLAEQRIGVAKYDLTLFVSESASGLQLDWEYNTDVFESNTIARMANHFGLLLNALTSTPNESVFKADMLSAPERQQLLVDWNSTQLDYQQDKCVHELFEAQAETNPQATALIFENQHLSYQQLNERANQLAHYLITEKHVTPDSLVGICVERSVEMVVGILAILKAGGAYVPLDPEYPQARLQYMLDDAGLTAVLTQGHLRDATPVSDEQAIYLDSAEFQQQWQAYPTSKPNSRAQGLTPNHLAYVIYTSGSTGNPKGVMVAHGNVVNFLATMADKPGLAPDDCLLAVTSTSFDIHGLEVFLPLVMGAKLVVAPRSATSDPDALATLLVQHQVSIMQATPATWKMLLDANWQPQAPLKALCGGEALGLHLAQALLAHQGLTLWNMYGPTETTIWSTTQEILATDKHILMGQPIGNTEVYIAGDSLALAPVGVAGELLLGGAGVTRGYLNRSDLTNDKFIPNPFYTGNNSASSERLYKTGDLVRWLPSGKLEFLGRIDHQVKVHGFRIELGEIEHALISHAEVKDAVVVAKDTKTGDKRLVAYIVAEGLAEANEPAAGGDEANTLAHQTLISTLRQHLGQSLPEYMVPAVFMVLDQLPLTPNGKVDRKSLPEPDLSRQQNTYVAPRTETEQAICDLWQDVLSVERVGITDNFFQLGGHSLSATRLVARINQSFTVALPLKTLFTSPTVESLVVALSALESGPVMPALVKVSREQALQPSFAQQRLWLLDQIEGGSAHYNMPGGLTLSGPLDYEALNKAFSDIIERHESLRTCFTVGNDGQPVQVIQAATPFLIPLTDLSTLEEGARNLQQAAQVVAEAGHVFDLSAGLMLRAGLLKLAEDEHFLLVTMHHIASDGWSMSILLNEVCALYRAYTEGKANPLPALPIQYADYAHWQRHWLQVEVLETQLGYWSRQLAGLPIVHNLPLDHARPALQSFSGDTYSSQLDVTISKALNTLCQSQGATLFMGLHAAFSVLLSRYSNETDIVVGSPIANREQADIAGLIGFFVNTLVLRSDLSGNPGFTSLLNQSKAMLLDAYAHQQVPFEQIVEQLQPERHLGYSPLFQVMLVLQNNAVGNLDIPGLTLSLAEQRIGVAKYDLTLFVSESASGLQLDWEYNTDVFESNTIARMANHFGLLLNALTSTPNESVFKADMLSAPERQQLLVDWNSTQLDYQQDKCVHELFEAQAETNPQATALIFENQHLSYQQLNERANQLAHYLITEKHVTPDSLVGICVERSVEMVVGILAILKAGGAYVPLDPEYPQARLQYMLDDAGLTAVLTQGHLRDATPVSDEQAIYLDSAEFQQQWQAYPTSKPNSRAQGLTPNHLAYVIYTSGSTGNPKGVLQTHRTISNLVQGVAIADKINRSLVTLQFASSSFDVSIQEIATAWHTGSTLLLISNEIKRNLIELPQLLRQHSVERMFLPPAVLYWLADTINESGFLPDLKEIFAAGEALILTESLAQFLRSHPECKLWNHYGPTETHVATCHLVALKNKEVPIGNVVSGLQAVVLNNELQITPVNVAGELYIGGAGLARGYLNLPNLTLEKFISNPFYDKSDSTSSERLYKTGDLVRWLPNGTLEFLGRIDHQVKIRGFRIELGEIEHALTSYVEVKEAVVLAKEFGSGDKRLVAYVVSDVADTQDNNEVSAHQLLIENIRHQLTQSLPDYMVPSAFVVLNHLPLTPNGKVDRRALPEPDMSGQQRAYAAPNTETEKVLCGIWQELLNLERVGITDNFFQIGGDSMKALRFVGKAREKGLFYSVRQLFTTSTIAELAKFSGDSLLNNVSQELVVGPVPLTSAQQWYFNAMANDPNRGTIASLQEYAHLDLEKFKNSLWQVLKHHDALRAKFIKDENGWSQTLLAPEDVVIPHDSYDISDLTTLEQIKFIDTWAVKRVEEGMDLSAAPLVNIQVFDRGNSDGFVVRIWIHHIMFDGFSLNVMFEDFNRCYSAALAGEDYIFPQKTLSVLEWQNTLFEYTNSVRLENEPTYWFGLPWNKILPLRMDFLDHPDKNNLGSFAKAATQLSKKETASLSLAASTYLNMSMMDVLIATLTKTFAAFNGTDRQLIKVVDTGRDFELDVDLSRTVGWIGMSRILMLETDVKADAVFEVKNILAQIQQVPNRGLGFELLQYYHYDKQLRQNINALPKPEILLNYHGILEVNNKSLFLGEYHENETVVPQFGLNNITHEKFICVSYIRDGQLNVDWEYNKYWYSEGTVRSIMDSFLNNLNALSNEVLSEQLTN